MVQYAGEGGIDSAALIQFEKTFLQLAQQERSRLESSGVVYYMPSDGKWNTLPRMGKVELVEVEGRNPRKQYADYSLDNRMFRKRRFTTTVLIDEKDDVNELITDPTSNIMRNLIAAKNRVADRVYSAAAIGPVLVGAPDGARSSVSASADGVVTIDATSGVNYGTYEAVIQKFVNQELPMDLILKSKLLITGKENTALMSEDKFINSRYIENRPVNDGYMKHAGAFETILFAGSESGGITVNNPILIEESTVRHCLALAPDAIAATLEIGSLRLEKSAEHVNSKELTIDVWVNAMRTEGARVIDIQTTI